jgi:hypothetical protein
MFDVIRAENFSYSEKKFGFDFFENSKVLKKLQKVF